MNGDQQPQQPQQPSQPSSSLGAAFAIKSPELSRWILSPEEIISQIDLWLRNAKIEYDEDGRIQITAEESKARLNEGGRRLALTPLLAMLNRNVVLSDLDERNIGELTEDYHIHIGETLLRNWRVIGVVSPLEIPEIVDYISGNVYSALNRAKKGATMKEISRLHMVQERVEHIGPEQQPQKKWGLF